MATGRIRRGARRGVAAAVLGWLGVAAFSVLMAPSATAASTYTVHIRDLTPPVASVDKGGTVTFINEIPDKTVQVGGGGLLPGLVTVTARTTVTLTLPSGDHLLQPAPDPTHPDPTSVFAEAFSSTCATCTITYAYSLTSGTALTAPLTDAAIKALPPLPLPTPFVVNTLVALPNLPSVNLPKLPPVTVPAPPSTGGLPSVGGGTTGVQAPGPTGQPTRGSTVSGIPGDAYTYNTGRGAPQMSPGSAIAASGFDASRYVALSEGAPGPGPAGSAGSAGSGGSGGQPGSYDGAPAPAFGLNGTRLSEDGAQRGGAPATLPGAALAAVIALAAVTSALVRTHRAARGTR